MTAHDLQAIVAQADETNQLLTLFLERVDQVRTFVAAFKYAARDEAAQNTPGESELSWPDLMEGLQRLFPDDSKLEVACHKTVVALHSISEGADPRGTPPAGSAGGGAKRTTRAALAAGATQQQ